MNHVRMALALVAVTGASLAASSQALASQFIAAQGTTESGVFALAGASGTESVQTFVLGNLAVRCSALGRGSLVAPGQSLAMSIKFKDCTTKVEEGMTAVPVKAKVGTMQVEYLAGDEARLLAPLTVEVKGLGCSYEVSAAGEESGWANYTNEKDPSVKLKQFPSGFQHKLGTIDELDLRALETGPCVASGPGGGEKSIGNGKVVDGYYEGEMPIEAHDANLAIEEGEAGPPEGWNIVTNIP